MRRHGGIGRARILAGLAGSLVLLGGPAASALSGSAAVAVNTFRTQPVVLTGADFPSWTSGPETTARAPQAPTDYEVYDSQGSEPASLQSDCYQSKPQPDVNGATD